MILGAGYLNWFHAHDKKDQMQVPSQVKFLEVGFDHLEQAQNLGVDISLHIARSPIVEDESNQDVYIRRLEFFKKYRLTSLGFHLSGERGSNIGRFGLTSHYTASIHRENNAIRFLKKIQSITGAEVWLENANFYSSSPHSIVDNWNSTIRVARETGTRLIVDLTHMFIDAMNVGVSPLALLGLIDWSIVSEIHLSGFNQSHDGAFHDGHNKSISDLIWCLLELIRKIYLKDESNVIVTIEHTDSNWNKNKNIYYEDFSKLCEIMKKPIIRDECKEINAEKYARSYLIKSLISWIPNLKGALDYSKIDLHEAINSWLENRFDAGKRIVLSPSDILEEEKKTVVNAASDFLAFIKQEFKR
jgi:uncharacterized protein (UPF0276 family)